MSSQQDHSAIVARETLGLSGNVLPSYEAEKSQGLGFREFHVILVQHIRSMVKVDLVAGQLIHQMLRVMHVRSKFVLAKAHPMESAAACE